MPVAEPAAPSPVVIVTGPVGIGKTTTALAVGDLLRAHDVSHTVVDLDSLGWTYPRPDDDRFNTRLALRTLADLVRHAREVGSTRLVLAYVIESDAEREQYREAIPGAEVIVVRLISPLERIHQRIAVRNTATGNDPDAVRWEEHRSAELIGIMDAGVVPDLALDTTDLTPAQAARAIVDWLGWIPEG